MPSLDGVMAGSLSTSSWTIMVFTDSVSPLLKFRDDLLRQNPEVKAQKNRELRTFCLDFHPLRVMTCGQLFRQKVSSRKTNA